MNLRIFGELVNGARKRGKLTQQALADQISEKLGLLISQQVVANWCRGKNLPKERSTLLALCESLYAAGGLMSRSEINQVLLQAEAGALHHSEIKEWFPDLVEINSVFSSGDEIFATQTPISPIISTVLKAPAVANLPANSLKSLKSDEGWIEAPDVRVFYGRKNEMSTLTRWIVSDQCRLLGIFGIGGIGKTTLAAKVGKQIKQQFEVAIWLSLWNAPTLEQILARCLQQLSGQQAQQLPEELDQRISLLLSYLHQHRCLIILDNAESILRECHTLAGHYRAGYDAYGQLMRRIGQTAHQSCVVLTSREKPSEFALLEGQKSLVRSYYLEGLDAQAARFILEDKSLSGSDQALQRLIDLYSGNPLMLKMTAETINTLFGGDVAQFLQTNELILGDVNDLLSQQFNRLSALEQDALYWLASKREVMLPHLLLNQQLNPASRRAFLMALESLKRRSLIECTAAGLTMQHVTYEYVNDQLGEQTWAAKVRPSS